MIGTLALNNEDCLCNNPVPKFVSVQAENNVTKMTPVN